MWYISSLLAAEKESLFNFDGIDSTISLIFELF